MTTLDSSAALLGAGTSRPVPTASAFRRLRIGPILSVLFLLFLVVAVVDPSLLAHYQPLAVDPAKSLEAPSVAHLFGTDESGRDVFSRVVYGATPSLSIGLAATALGLAIAIVLGALAGLGGRVVDAIIGRILEILFAFPALLLALLFVTIFGASVESLIISVGLGSAPGYARMVRGQILAVKSSPYVEASYVLGHSRWRVLGRTVLPNAMRPLLVLATLGIGQSIIWASSLSFLGLGAAPPAPEWGAMLADGREFISTAWWVELFPGAMIVFVTLATTSLGRYLQRRLEGRGADA
ncbi:MAG TPA: ABC transporter permease [Galbitalea sp.]|nr:ABC transporter permease [Galbitalea sp.]